jgi:hypothetical protein
LTKEEEEKQQEKESTRGEEVKSNIWDSEKRGR